MAEFLIEGDVNIAGSRIILPVFLATAVAGVVLPVTGTVTNTDQGTVVVATVLSPVPITGTVVDQGTVTVGAGTLTFEQLYLQTNIATGVVVTTVLGATLVAATLQDLVVDVTFGTVFIGTITGTPQGSVLAAVTGVDPQSHIRTSTVAAGTWVASTVQTGQRIQAVGPLGGYVAVVVQPATAGTLLGTVTSVFVTAEQSTGR